jgi:predicted transcriptional regulator
MKAGDFGRFQSEPDGVHAVTDPVQARLLYDSVARRFLAPFLARETTIGEVAASLEADIDAVTYRVRSFLKAGLLHVKGERKRAGRPIKVYRSVHDRYFIPFSITPFATLEEQARAMLEPTMRQQARLVATAQAARETGGNYFYRNERDDVWFGTELSVTGVWEPADQDWPRLNFSREIYLTRSEAEEIRELFRSLLSRPTGSRAAERREYALSSFMMPTDSER